MDSSNRIEPRVLIACETSGIVREAFRDRGFDAWSCDLLPSEDDSAHHRIADARDLLAEAWDLIIVAHPPCTRLCNSGVRWLTKAPAGRTLEDMWSELDEAADFFAVFLNADCPMVAIENPVMHKHAKKRIPGYRDFSQSIQPWQYGHGETKRTCLWLKGLPNLEPTDVVEGREARVHNLPPGPNRWKERSRFYTGIAAAMAQQWGDYADSQIWAMQQPALI